MSLTEHTLKVDKEVAKEALRAYREAKAPATDEDRAIMTAYREIARGRMLIQAIESIRKAGWNDEGLPKLAIIRADVRECECQTRDAGVEFKAPYNGARAKSLITVDRMPPHPPNSTWRASATPPLIPLHLRPTTDLKNYHILWEADWRRPPHDPLLLRRLQGDLWLVLAAWELTAVERAVLEQRVNG
jgi:hypothetical protein